ncbi:hypothetical protein HYY71_05200 [Candidatus Woesearchaeota archaeon]|nr:hypothetical protein [Candidatus Woesearchaeota archaeon]
MNLVYQCWNLDREKARQIVDSAMATPPFNQIFEGAVLEDRIKLPKITQSGLGIRMCDVWLYARNARVDTSSERVLVLTTNLFYETSRLGIKKTEELIRQGGFFNGLTFRNDGISFARPIKNQKAEGLLI